MVTITNGVRTFTVSKGAFNSVYKSMGFRIADGKEKKAGKGKTQAPPPPPPPDEDDEDEEEEPENDGTGNDGGLDVEALLEKPLSQWTPDELKQFVQVKGIDTSGATKVKEVRTIVKNYLDEQAKNG